jgi:hypothetical protein
MRCYDRSKCAVDPIAMARFSTRSLGQVDPATMAVAQGANDAMGKILNLFAGLFGKDPNKAEYDNLRQQLWEEFANIVGEVDNLRAQGKLRTGDLLAYIQVVERTMQELKALTDRYRAKIESAWIDPRFHDFYDFMKQVVNDWRQRLLPTLPSGGGSIGSVFSEAGSSGSGLLITGGLLLLSLLTKGRSA